VLLLAVVATVGLACGNGSTAAAPTRMAPTPRRTMLWVGAGGIDEEVGLALQRSGVDELVVRRGTVDLSGGTPVVRMRPAPPLPTRLPVGLCVTLEGLGESVPPELAEAVWRGIDGELGGDSPAELIVDLPRIAAGLGAFLSRLIAVSGVPVVPLLMPEQVRDAPAAEVVRICGACVVPVSGALGTLRQGSTASDLPLAELLAPLGSLGARVRVGVVLDPETEPPLPHWGDPIDPLCDGGLTEISTRSRLDRTFTFKRGTTWSGRAWRPGETLATRWVDLARLDAILLEASRVVLPEVGGYDLIGLQPSRQALGVGWEPLLRYLDGEGPAPVVVVRPTRTGDTIQVRLENASPFASAISAVGNWVEVAAERGGVAVDRSGTFDRAVLGSHRGGEWRQTAVGEATAVRFLENRVGPGEVLETGPARLVLGRVRATVRWQVVLSTGDTVTGESRL
jgi:hypothetical protein